MADRHATLKTTDAASAESCWPTVFTDLREPALTSTVGDALPDSMVLPRACSAFARASTVHPQVVALSTIVEDARLGMQPLIAMRKQRIESDLAHDISHMLADQRSVRQVMAHLLRNASQYCPAGQLIRVWAGRADVQVRVTDDNRGPGIPAERRAGLFERFYRVPPGYDEPGIGLGMAIANEIIEAHVWPYRG